MPPRLGKNARGKTVPPVKAADEEEQLKDPQYIGKDGPLLAQVFQQYEEKKYAASVKSADLLLKKYPNHAREEAKRAVCFIYYTETLCMKGLSTYNLGKHEEGKDLARRGLGLDLKSHVCWHVNALIHRADREYVEALKCYSQAHRVEPNDMNVLRDLINLQLYLRRYDAAIVSRLNLLRLQPRIRYNWTALAVAYHLHGDHARAIEYLNTYCDMLEAFPPHDFEYSEVVLYRLQLLLEAGRPDQAWQILERDGKRIVDIQGKKQMTATILRRLGKTKAAELRFAELLEDNPDHRGYIREYLTCKGIDLASVDDSNRQTTLDALAELTDRLPRSRTLRRTVLDISVDEIFRKRMSAYLVDGLTRGIPSLFSDIKRLLGNKTKLNTILLIALSFKKALEDGKTLEGEDSDDDTEEAPTTYVWLLYFLSQIYLHSLDYTSALKLISIALAHTPVLPELHMTKARILKRSGDLIAAEDAMAQARFLDGQDRFLNAKHAKYLLNIDEVESAEEVSGLFTRKEAPSPLSDLTDMQCLWFLLAEGDSFRRQGKLGLALKRYHTIEKIFAEIYEDELEFHAYCMRKFTLRACINMVRSNNVLRKHPGFLRAARGAIEIYLHLDGHASETAQINGFHTNGVDGINGAEKHEMDTKKAETKPRADTEKKTEEAAVKDGDEPQDESASPVDEDPLGEKLHSTKTPLKDLEVFIDQIDLLGADSMEAQGLIFEVAFRKKQYLRALKALHDFHRISSESFTLHPLVVRYAVLVQSPESGLPDHIKPIILRSLESLVPLASVSLEAFNTEYIQSHAGVADAALAAAKAQWTISGQRDKDGVAAIVMQILRQENKATLPIIKESLQFLRHEVLADPSILETFCTAAKILFPDATILKTPEEVNAQRSSIATERRKYREAGEEIV